MRLFKYNPIDRIRLYNSWAINRKRWFLTEINRTIDPEKETAKLQNDFGKDSRQETKFSLQKRNLQAENIVTDDTGGQRNPTKLFSERESPFQTWRGQAVEKVWEGY